MRLNGFIDEGGKGWLDSNIPEFMSQTGIVYEWEASQSQNI